MPLSHIKVLKSWNNNYSNKKNSLRWEARHKVSIKIDKVLFGKSYYVLVSRSFGGEMTVRKHVIILLCRFCQYCDRECKGCCNILEPGQGG